MTHDCLLRTILVNCKEIEYYLPSVETEISPEVAASIRDRLYNIELTAKMLEDSHEDLLRRLQHEHPAP